MDMQAQTPNDNDGDEGMTLDPPMTREEYDVICAMREAKAKNDTGPQDKEALRENITKTLAGTRDSGDGSGDDTDHEYR